MCSVVAVGYVTARQLPQLSDNCYALKRLQMRQRWVLAAVVAFLAWMKTARQLLVSLDRLPSLLNGGDPLFL